MNTVPKNILASTIVAISLGAISSTVVAGKDESQRMLIQQATQILQAKQKAQAVEAGKFAECNRNMQQTQNPPKS